MSLESNTNAKCADTTICDLILVTLWWHRIDTDVGSDLKTKSAFLVTTGMHIDEEQAWYNLLDCGNPGSREEYEKSGKQST